MDKFVLAIESIQEEIRESESFNSMDARLISELDMLKGHCDNEVIKYVRAAIRTNGSEFQPRVDTFLRTAQAQQLYNNDLTTNQSMPINNTPSGGPSLSSPPDNKSMNIGEESPKTPQHQVTDPTDINTTIVDLIQKLGHARDAAYLCGKNIVDNKEIASLYFQLYKKLERITGYAETISKHVRKH
jgi:hypothetical protein